MSPGHSPPSNRRRKRRGLRFQQRESTSGRSHHGPKHPRRSTTVAARNGRKRRHLQSTALSFNQKQAGLQSIEEQLQRQRNQKRKDTTDNGRTESTKSHAPQKLGDYRFDATRQAYFHFSEFQEKDDVDDGHDERSKGNGQFTVRLRSVPFLSPISSGNGVDPRRSTRNVPYSWLFSRQVSTDTNVRHRLSSFACSRMQMAKIRLTAAAAEVSPPGKRTSQWSFLFGTEIAAGMDFQTSSQCNDLTCKIHRPSWLKTFDVWSPPGRYANESLSSLQLQVSTVVEGGYDIRSNYSRGTNIARQGRNFQPGTFNPQTVRYLRIANGGDTSASSVMNHLAMLDSNERQSSLRICSISSLVEPEDEGFWMDCRFQYPFPAHDVVDDGAAGFLIASSRGGAWHTSLGQGNTRSSQLTIRHCKSEILCLDRLGSRDQHFCFGHRNGAVSIYDMRDSKLGCTLDDNESETSSIASIKAFDSETAAMRENMVFVRNKSLGNTSLCTVWDVRNNAAPMFRLELPAAVDVHSRFTQKCSGMAVDPYGTTLFSPFVQNHANGERPCLGAWSLLTGEWIGSKCLASASDDIPASSASTVSWVELCSRRSSAWERSKEEYEQSHDDTSAQQESDANKCCIRKASARSFGLWYKCGMQPHDVGDMTPALAGNIHHIVI